MCDDNAGGITLQIPTEEFLYFANLIEQDLKDLPHYSTIVDREPKLLSP